MNTLGPPTQIFKHPLVSDLMLFGMELGSGKPVSARGFSDQNSVKLTPWVESRGRSDRSALPSHYHSSRTARDPAGTALGREIRGNCRAILGDGGGPSPSGIWDLARPGFSRLGPAMMSVGSDQVVEIYHIACLYMALFFLSLIFTITRENRLSFRIRREIRVILQDFPKIQSV